MRDEAAIRADLAAGAPEKMASPQAWGRWAAGQERLAADVPALLDELTGLRAAIDAALAICAEDGEYGEPWTHAIRAALGATTTQTSDEPQTLAQSLEQETERHNAAMQQLRTAAVGVPEPQPKQHGYRHGHGMDLDAICNQCGTRWTFIQTLGAPRQCPECLDHFGEERK